MSTYTVGQRVMYRDYGWVYPKGKDYRREWGQLIVEVEVVKVTAKRLRIRFDDGRVQVCDPAKSITPVKGEQSADSVNAFPTEDRGDRKFIQAAGVENE